MGVVVAFALVIDFMLAAVVSVFAFSMLFAVLIFTRLLLTP